MKIDSCVKIWYGGLHRCVYLHFGFFCCSFFAGKVTGSDN